FLFSLDGEAREPDKAPVDRFHLEVDTPGDERVSRFVLDAEDRALWDLRVDFIRSKYFYEVPSLFGAPVQGDLRLDDLHDFDLTRGCVYAHDSLDASRTRFRDGTSMIPSDNGPNTQVDAGNASLSTQLANLGASVRLTPIATLHLDYRYDDRSQDGDLDALLDPGRLQASTHFHVALNRVSSDVEVRPTKSLALRAGVQYAHRDAAFSTADQSIGTDLVGAVAEGRWQPVRWLDLFFRYDNVQIDDPWTIPGNSQSVPALPSREIAYTFQNRGKAGFRLRPRDWLQLAYDFTADSFENADFNGRVQRFAD